MYKKSSFKELFLNFFENYSDKTAKGLSFSPSHDTRKIRSSEPLFSDKCHVFATPKNALSPALYVSDKTIALIMAGNIPLVGFHDFLACIVAGHNLVIKQSSNDKHLLPFIVSYLTHEESLIKSKIKFIDNKIERFDAVIATGSNNTARYFNSYFKNKPSIIRNNRNSIAILNGNESENDLKNLSNDIFRYYGLGCRSVSKIYVPKNYDFNILFKAVYDWHPVINIRKYLNNYDYNKAVYIMSEFDIIENGFLMLKEDRRLSSPIATLFYEYYDDVSELKCKLKAISSEIQCVVANGFSSKEIKFGSTQSPTLEDYADGIDTVDFLLKI